MIIRSYSTAIGGGRSNVKGHTKIRWSENYVKGERKLCEGDTSN